ncbi:MAG: hypothetical protein II244_00500, partial [Clostridia bacterium]|nr:hypothetical protein [Clostridia bacterium]
MKNSRIKNIMKKYIEMYPVTIPSIVVCMLLCFALFIYNVYFAVAGLLLIAILVIVGFAINNVKFKKLEGAVAELNKRISADEKYGELQYFPLPVVIFDNTDKMLWYNQLFSNAFLQNGAFQNDDIKQFTSGQGITTIREKHSIECEFNDKKYTVFGYEYSSGKQTDIIIRDNDTDVICVVTWFSDIDKSL